MREALVIHLAAMRKEGGQIPLPKSYSTYVELGRNGRKPRRGSAS